jgi:hypothetical protein
MLYLFFLYFLAYSLQIGFFNWPNPSSRTMALV